MTVSQQQEEQVHDIVVWGRISAPAGSGPPPLVIVDDVRIPGVHRVTMRDNTPEDDSILPFRDPRPSFVRQAYDVVLTFVEDRDGRLWAGSIEEGPQLLHPLRPAASVHDQNGRPQARDSYAAYLEQRLTESTEGEAEVTAALLDELAALYRDEPLGRLAERLAGRIHDQAGH